MTKQVPEILEKFAEYGGLFGIILGILIIVLIAAVVVLWRTNTKQAEEIKRLQDKRVKEAKEINDSIMAHSLKTQEVVNRMTSAMEGLQNAIFMSAQR
jgi:uncharacterized membrane protein